eukprot:CAMPEP_0202916094 /NCGR_PEP_ID=MMETSP1392-20130828/67622_1 /ASSEMBLY_ACC=CAM_ASM_000868 /TAXON_ID=225041 /ORGANISM="Chlamydomonas chlamydogama, Strain SAG 11-48b" /LENGTH=40 /DNA_ID= /DNA_START= /DNA_END= /DNA_ORIENTATION=
MPCSKRCAMPAPSITNEYPMPASCHATYKGTSYPQYSHQA